MASESKRVAVLGAGANGAGVGAELAAAGVDVTLIEQWPAHVEKMRADGLRIEMPEDRVLEQPVDARHLCEVAEIKQPFDVVLMLMKAYDSRWAAELIKPVLAEDGLLAGVQNGFTADVIADVVGPERAIGCVIECSAMMEQPGVVERHTPPESSWFAVGSPQRGDRRARVRGRRPARPRRPHRGRRRHPLGEVDEAGLQRDHAGDDGDPRRTDAGLAETRGDARPDDRLRPGGAPRRPRPGLRDPTDLRPHRRRPHRRGRRGREAPRRPLRGLRPADHDHDDPPRLVEGPPQRGRRHQRRRRRPARRRRPREQGSSRDGPPHRTRRPRPQAQQLRRARPLAGLA